MQFTQIPQQYAPLGGELRYAVGQKEAGNIDIRIVEAAAGIADTTAAGTGTGTENEYGSETGIAGANEAEAPAAGKAETEATVTARVGTEAAIGIAGAKEAEAPAAGKAVAGTTVTARVGTETGIVIGIAGANEAEAPAAGKAEAGTEVAIRVGTVTAGKTASEASTARSDGSTNAIPDDSADATPTGKTDAAQDGNADATPDGYADAAQDAYADAAPAGKTDAATEGNANAVTYSNANAAPVGKTDAATYGSADGNRTAGKAKATGPVHMAGPVGDGSALLGAKRFAAVTAAEFDIAPYLRRRVRFVPATGGTGFHPAAGRTVTVLVEAAATDGNAEAVSPARTFRPGAETAEAPCLLTSMPLSRLIPEGACDELTLLTEGPCTVTVTALAGDTASAESYRAAKAGLQVFRLDLRDFPDAESLTVDAGACGTVVYTVIPARQEAVRLAWRSRAGSVEHYSFPVVQTTVVRSVRQQAYGPDGRTPATAETDRETVLVSAYEGREVLEALAELTAAPEVWIVRGDTYTPVDIATEEAVVQRHGTLSCLEIAVRPKRKTRTSWN